MPPTANTERQRSKSNQSSLDVVLSSVGINSFVPSNLDPFSRQWAHVARFISAGFWETRLVHHPYARDVGQRRSWISAVLTASGSTTRYQFLFRQIEVQVLIEIQINLRLGCPESRMCPTICTALAFYRGYPSTSCRVPIIIRGSRLISAMPVSPVKRVNQGRGIASWR